MTIAQALARGLQLDPSSFEIGRSDCRRRAPCRCPLGFDPYSYQSGYLEEQMYGACCGGERAQPEAA